LRSGTWRVQTLDSDSQAQLEDEARFYMLILPTYINQGVTLPSLEEVKAYNASVESSELDEAFNRNSSAWSKVKKHIFDNYEAAKLKGVKFPSKGFHVTPIYLTGDWENKLKKACEKVGDTYNSAKVAKRFNNSYNKRLVVADEDISDAVLFSSKDFIHVIERDYGLLLKAEPVRAVYTGLSSYWLTTEEKPAGRAIVENVGWTFLLAVGTYPHFFSE